MPNRMALFALLGSILLPMATASVTAAERNIVVVISDDESPTLGCYGDPVAVTPAIDAIAADGVLFRNAFATTASCSASRSVVLSGIHNHRNGQYGHRHHYHKFSSFLDVVSLSLPRALARGGYRTARIGKYHVAPEVVYHFETTLRGSTRHPVEMANNCESFIAAEDDRPFFLYFATSDPHRGGGVDPDSPLEFKPDLFGNLPGGASRQGIDAVEFDPADVAVPAFLPDAPETREELAEYYQSCNRVDQGLARLVEILRRHDVYDKTLILFTADHGMAFPGGKTTVYEGGLKVPMVVRDPYQPERGFETDALISHVDITPTLLDFAGALDRDENAPKYPLDAAEFYRGDDLASNENRDGGEPFDHYHGKSWMPCLSDPDVPHHESVFASHTFHEIQMYYPMRVIRDNQYKLIWNIAHPLPYPFASDLWAASTWQARYREGKDANYGNKTVGEYIQRPEFELFDIRADPGETTNLADDPNHTGVLSTYQKALRDMQTRFDDPWVLKWKYE